MERVLSSVEILGLIFEDGDMDKKSLAKSARVCRTWFEPAVRVLWTSLGKVSHLLRLIPEIKCEGDNNPVHVSKSEVS